MGLYDLPVIGWLLVVGIIAFTLVMTAVILFRDWRRR